MSQQAGGPAQLTDQSVMMMMMMEMKKKNEGQLVDKTWLSIINQWVKETNNPFIILFSSTIPTIEVDDEVCRITEHGCLQWPFLLSVVCVCGVLVQQEWENVLVAPMVVV